MQESDFGLDLTAVFGLMKRQVYSPDLSPLNIFGNINITEVLKHFQNGEFKSRLRFIRSDRFNFIKIINKI